MRAPRNWRNWRISIKPCGDAALDLPPARANLAEQPGPDGIRWGLVNRVRAEIAAGTYETDEKLAAAEEKLFAAMS